MLVSSSEKQLFFSRFFFGFLRHEKKCSFRALKSNFFFRFFVIRKKMFVSSSEKQLFFFGFFFGFLRHEKKCLFRALKINFFLKFFVKVFSEAKKNVCFEL